MADERTRPGWSGRKLVALITGVAVVSLAAGIAVMQFIVSPATVAARSEPPKAGPVTAAIEQRVVRNTVTLRGEVSYADAVAVPLTGGSGTSKAVITGHVPEVGAVFRPGNIALEIAGRPVIVFEGALPAYRDLSLGMRGPDVMQLKQALFAMGYASGVLDNDTFEWDTSAGLGALYSQLGYEPATGGKESADALRAAERAVRDANVQVAQAQATLDHSIAEQAPSVPGDRAALESARLALSDAQTGLGEAQAAVLPTLPAGEALFATGLPVRVDEMKAKRGDVLSGTPLKISGATLSIHGTVSQQDADLLTEGLQAEFAAPDGTKLTATLTKKEAPKATNDEGSTENPPGSPGQGSNPNARQQASTRPTMVFMPQELTPQQLEALRGTNVRLSVPVASTDGEVLAVPIAALSAGSGGENRVELVVDEKEGHNAVTELIEVETGLSADGFVEIKSTDERIVKGAKLVVGK